MKKLLFLLLFATCAAHAQDAAKRNTLALTYAAGDADLSYNSGIVGTGSKVTNSFYGIGLLYNNQVNNLFSFETGLMLLTLKYTQNGAPFTNYIPSREEQQVVSIPLKARLTFARYFYINGGALVDIETKNTKGVDDQTGVGLSIGAGAKYVHSSGFGLFVNPQYNWHGILTLDETTPKLKEAGVYFGVSYSF